MPDPGSIWGQFPVVALLVLVVAALGIGARKFWREFTGWLDTQDAKRDAEREAQRSFEREQSKLREDAQDKRDESWRSTVKEMQKAQTTQAAETNTLLTQLVQKMNDLGSAVHEHDEWARQAIEEMPQAAVEQKKTMPRRRTVKVN